MRCAVAGRFGTLFLLLIAGVLAASAPSALAGSDTAGGEFVINDSIPPNSVGNVFSNPFGSSTRSQCPNSVAGQQFSGGPFHYEVYTFKTLNGWWVGGANQAQLTCANVACRSSTAPEPRSCSVPRVRRPTDALPAGSREPRPGAAHQ